MDPAAVTAAMAPTVSSSKPQIRRTSMGTRQVALRMALPFTRGHLGLAAAAIATSTGMEMAAL